MTPKIERFLAEQKPPTPCVVLDLDRVEQNFHDIRTAFPQARVFYALKANPAPPVLRRLVALGSHFDAASWEEIELCLAAGAPPERISFGNTIKKAASIRRAHAAGIRLYVFDCEPELRKIAANAPGASVFCRLAVGSETAVFPLCRKFGTSPDQATRLLQQAASLGLDAYGLSFHVGSQQITSEAYEAAIGVAAMIFDDLEKAGFKLRMVNLGGGFPKSYHETVPEMPIFGERIRHALQYHFGNDLPDVLLEPGRFLVGDAAVVESEVVLVSQRLPNDQARWVYLDIGKFGGLNETYDEATKYQLSTPGVSGLEGPVIIAGPTCDSADTLYEHTSYTLPLALKEGDRVRFLSAGAYVTTYATNGFNGFRPPDEHYI